MAALTYDDVAVLMKLQYEFEPLSPDPYAAAASPLGLNEEELLDRLKRLHKSGIIKRVGFYVNYRSQGREAALIALDVTDVDAVREAVSSDLQVTHAYVRDDPDYNVWLVVKRPGLQELVRAAQDISARARARKFVVLRSLRTFKLSVKYDLVAGVSRSGPYSTLRPNPPRPEDIGVEPGLPSLVSRLPLVEDPYGAVASYLNVDREHVINAVKRLLESGVLADPGAALDGERLGFRFNGMILLDPRGPVERACKVVSRHDNTTHVVLRETYPATSFRYRCYAMVHAVRKELVEQVARQIAEAADARSWRVVYSYEDLKPGFVR